MEIFNKKIKLKIDSGKVRSMITKSNHAIRLIRIIYFVLVPIIIVFGGTIPKPVLASETVTYYHSDVLGSPVAATDESGNLLWEENYRPYGSRINLEPTSKSNSRWLTGHSEEFSGQNTNRLVYMGARYYDPIIGRFLSIDPVSFESGNIYNFNSYSYANNNPQRYWDPDGASPKDRYPGASGRLRAPFVGADAGYGPPIGSRGGTQSTNGGGLTFGSRFRSADMPRAQVEKLIKERYKTEKLLPSTKTMDHHLLPRQFKKYFEERGIRIDDHTVTLGERTHLRGVHGKGDGNMPGGWNTRWRNYIENNPNATAKDVYQELGRMMDEFGLSGSRIHPYRK